MYPRDVEGLCVYEDGDGSVLVFYCSDAWGYGFEPNVEFKRHPVSGEPLMFIIGRSMSGRRVYFVGSRRAEYPFEACSIWRWDKWRVPAFYASIHDIGTHYYVYFNTMAFTVSEAVRAVELGRREDGLRYDWSQMLIPKIFGEDLLVIAFNEVFNVLGVSRSGLYITCRDKRLAQILCEGLGVDGRGLF